ncbi:MAG: hypothetical protein LH480_10180 [Rubrivivax sp.]|nr:hypothetical protein [Rubrivivax sp.]
MRRATTALVTLAAFALAGCDQLGIESASAVAAKREAESRAIGAGCRHSARSVEQCYSQNKRAEKAAVFAGWKEMNEYMAENKIEAVPAEAATELAAAAAETEGDDKTATTKKP